ncbi:DgyrCDS8635 [Dimorphilus gyrociliatus]|uniref:DgyrCDS8635 n=1 Tax=Dimorphilus gyrociliatus TaxID=2664684 RepID=A0A7I8VUS8_9ANNE|nr:DgyrCDS8635 [Dimorphilus gyrociliatus]
MESYCLVLIFFALTIDKTLQIKPMKSNLNIEIQAKDYLGIAVPSLKRSKRNIISTRRHCFHLAQNCNYIFIKLLEKSYHKGFSVEGFSGAYKKQLSCLKSVNKHPCKVKYFHKIKKRIQKITSYDCKCELKSCNGIPLEDCSVWYCQQNAFQHCNAQDGQEKSAQDMKSICKPPS